MKLVHGKTLPPKPEYVEVEIDGVRQYHAVPLSAKRQEELATITDLQCMVVDYEYRLILLELGVTDNAV